MTSKEMKSVAYILFTLLYFIVSVCLFIYSDSSDRCANALVALLIHYLAGMLLLFQVRGRLGLLSPQIVFFIFFEILIGLGSIIVYVFPNILSATLTEGETLFQKLNTYMFVMAFAILSFAIGATRIRWKKSDEFLPVLSSDAPIILSLYQYKQIILAGLLICLCVASLRFILHPNILQLLNDFVSSSIVGADFRSNLTQNQYQGGQYFGQGYFNFIIYRVFPFFFLLTFMIYDFKGKKFLKYGILLLTAIFLFGELRRGPIISLILVLIIYKFLKDGGINMKKLFVGMLVLFCFAVFAMFLMSGQEFDFKKISMSVFFRIFISQTQTGTFVFQIVPELQDFAFGMIYLDNFSGLLPGANKSFSAQVFEIIHGRIGGASHSSFVEAYANFGTIGAIIFSFFLGCYLKSVYRAAAINQTNGIRFCYYVIFLSTIVPAMATGSITGSIIQIVILNICVYIFQIVQLINASVKVRKKDEIIQDRKK